MAMVDQQRSNPPIDGAGVPATVFDRIPLPLRRTVYYIGFLGVMLALMPLGVLELERLLLPSIALPLAVRILGGVIAVGFLGAYTACSFHLMSRGAGTYVEFDPPKHFVATGPFRWCRNPIAASLVGMILGEALAFSSLGLLIVFLIALPIAHAQVVLVEEPLLTKRFGSTYEEYRRTVPRWIPRPPRNAGS